MTDALSDPLRLSVEELSAGRHALYAARLRHVLDHMARADAAALLLVDPNDIGYVTGARNMTVFTSRTPARYLLVLASGRTILYDFVGCEHLAAGLPTIDEVRTAEGLNTVSSGGRTTESSARFAAEIAAAVRAWDPSVDRIHIDRFPFQASDALRAEGFSLGEADDVLVPARAIKLAIELPYIREAMARIDLAVARLEAGAEPGRSEAEV